MLGTSSIKVIFLIDAFIGVFGNRCGHHYYNDPQCKGIGLDEVSQSPYRVIVVNIYNPDPYGNLGNSSQLGLRFSRNMRLSLNILHSCDSYIPILKNKRK